MSDHLAQVAQTRLSPGLVVRPPSYPLKSADASRQGWQSDQQFIAMLDAYRPSGGLARAQEVASMCQSYGETSIPTLAHWITTRQVISFEWQGKVWLPLFQFKLPGITPQPGLGDALSELVVTHDDWDTANWFSLPNPWLADDTPADRLASAAAEVLNAARAERYVTTG